MKKKQFPDDTPKNLTPYSFHDIDDYIAYIEWLSTMKKQSDDEDENKSLSLDYYEWKDLLDDYDAR